MVYLIHFMNFWAILVEKSLDPQRMQIKVLYIRFPESSSFILWGRSYQFASSFDIVGVVPIQIITSVFNLSSSVHKKGFY